MRELLTLFGRLFFAGLRRAGPAVAPDPTWVITPGDGQITFVSTPDFPVLPATFTASPTAGGIVFGDIL